ncbi:unnamed protein product, partial [Rotaria magnacalcarata]
SNLNNEMIMIHDHDQYQYDNEIMMSKTQVKLYEYFSKNAASIKSKRVSSLSSITSEREHEPSLSSSSSSSIVQMEFGLFSSSLSTTSVEYGSSGSTITTS